MSSIPSQSDRSNAGHSPRPFRRAVLRGLAVVTPPLLTIVIFLWIGNTIQVYVLVPVETIARGVITSQISGSTIKDEVPDGVKIVEGDSPYFIYNDEQYVPTENGQWVPLSVYETVASDKRHLVPSTALGIVERYVEIRYLNRYVVVPLFLSVFIIILYLLGKFLAAGMGRFIWSFFEQLIHRLPIIRNVYGSVKQVSDFVLSEREMEYTRVVAVEYPRKGIWSIGFVTGESFLDIRSAANEPVVSVLMPTSPMPATGFTITVRKSETIDVNITVDQAFQFCLSCGVVVPRAQQSSEDEVKAIIQGAIAQGSGEPTNGTDGDEASSLPTSTDEATKG